MTSPEVIALEKSPVSENGRTQPKPPPKEPSEINKFLIANASFAVWLVFLAFGGGVLALYYARIGYLPEIEWKASLIYLFIGSIVGGVIGLLLTISVYLPGVIWSETIVFDPCLKFIYPPPSNDEADKKPASQLCLRTIFGYLGLPFLLVLLASHTALLTRKVGYWFVCAALLGLTFLIMRSLLKHRVLSVNSDCAKAEGYSKQEPWSYVWSSLKSDFSRARRKVDNAFRWMLRKPKIETEATTLTAVDRHAFKLASLFTLSVLLNQISMYVIYWLSGSPATLWNFVALTLLCTTGVWITTHAVSLRHVDYPWQALAISLVAAGLLLFTADNFSSLSVKLMNHFGIGYYKRVNLHVSQNGQEIVDRLGVPRCGKLQLCNVEILSKVGDQYFLRVGDTWYVTLPKPDVVAIRPLN